MFVSQWALKIWKPYIDLFLWGEEKNLCRMVEEEERGGTANFLTSYGIPLTPVSSLNYLGRILLVADDNSLAVVRNLRLARKKWVRLTLMLGKEGVDAQTLGVFYVVLV